MGRKPRKSATRPPSLYRTVVERRNDDVTSDMTSIPDADRAVVREILNAGSVDETLRENLALLEHAAAAAERDGFSNYAGMLRKHLALLQRFRTRGNMDAAIVEAMSLAAAYERLRADTGLARPIDAYRRSRSKLTVSDEQIVQAIAKHGTLKDAAAAVGLSERQLRTRRAQIEKRRKSVGPPPTE